MNKNYARPLKALIIGTLSISVLTACQKPAPQNPIAETVSKFESDRSEGILQYGVRTYMGKDQNLAALDCVVFNQAAKDPVPTNSLGAMSAYLDSMQLRLQIGCAQAEETLPQYETARRLLSATWENLLTQSPHNIQGLLRTSNMGKLVESQIKEVATDEKSCWGIRSYTLRERGSKNTMVTLRRNCGQQANWGKVKDQCANAWNIITSHQYAQGPRDDASYMAELIGRYRWMYNGCSGTAPAEYMQFHSTVPQHLFQGPAYRFAIPLDPLAQCHIQGMNEKKAKRRTYLPNQEYMACAHELGLRTLYIKEILPNIITSEEIRNTTPWLSNPQRASENPQLWSFNECEKNMIYQLQSQGLNQVGPASIKNHCLREKRRPGRR